ncbi:MAG: aminotransferase class I/II-fold pyridoxal phosphate-dependent enzyme [Candidatus Gastranaerophilaceae bacterium]|nr:aminotransferase class I/II-fold pyridoxal phosphate-dependent enzyme [Candidatus Gastranaerophilaceae bacterium]
MTTLEEKIFNKDVMSLETYIMFRLKEKTESLREELTKRNRKPIFLSMGAPTTNPPKKLIKRVKELMDEPKIHLYATPRGEVLFRKAISQRMKERFGVDINPETEVFSLIGSKEGIANLIRFMTTQKEDKFEKDIFMVPDPCYASYWQFIKCSGGYGYHLPLTPENDFKPNIEEYYNKMISEGFNPDKLKAVIINYPNNPLGVGTTKEYVKSVVDFCKEHQVLLISDAAYCDMYFTEKEKPFSVFEIEGAKDIAVEFYSFSKPYSITGWRLGWICGNEAIVQRFGKGKSTIDNGIFKVLQIACAEFLNSPEGDEYIKKGNIDYKHKQSIVVNGFRELGWSLPENKIPHTTFYMWLPIPPRYKSSYEFCEEVLEKSGIVLVPGNAFGDYGEGYFRLSYVSSEKELHEVINRLKADGFSWI